jgi:streptogramin lyase
MPERLAPMKHPRFWPLPLLILVGCTGVKPSGSAAIAIPPCPSPAIIQNQGIVSTLATGATSLYNLILDDHDNLYTISHAIISKLTPDGKSTAITKDGSLISQQIETRTVPNPLAIAVAPDGTLYALAGLDQLYKMTVDGTVTTKALPPLDVGNPGLIVDHLGNVYISINSPNYGPTSPGQSYIAKVTPDGTFSLFAGQKDVSAGLQDGQGTAARFSHPSALAVDAANNLYVADAGNYAIRRVTPDGTVTTVVGKGAPVIPPSPMPGMPSPDLTPLYQGTITAIGLTVDPVGNLYYTSNDNRVHRITPAGQSSVFAGDGTPCPPNGLACLDTCPATPPPDTCYKDGPAASAEFYLPSTVMANQEGKLYVLDRTNNYENHRIRVIQ